MGTEEDLQEEQPGFFQTEKGDLIAALVLVGIVLLIGIIAIILRYPDPPGPPLPTPEPTAMPVLAWLVTPIAARRPRLA